MGEYFKPLRRKLGILTLLIACAMATVWVRSTQSGDMFLNVRSPIVDLIISANGELNWLEWDQGKVNISNEAEFGMSPTDLLESYGTTRQVLQEKGFAPREVSIPYWSVVIPLTLLSAWLLLSKRREPTVSEPF